MFINVASMFVQMIVYSLLFLVVFLSPIIIYMFVHDLNSHKKGVVNQINTKSRRKKV